MRGLGSRIALMMKNGISIDTIAEIEQISVDQVKAIADKAAARAEKRAMVDSLYTEQLLEDAANRVKNGERLAAIARENNVSYPRLRLKLIRHGLVAAIRTKKWPDHLLQEIHRRMAVEHYPASLVASQLNISDVVGMSVALSRWRRKNGIAPARSNGIDKTRVYDLHKQGLAIGEIAAQTGYSRSGVYMTLLKLKASGKDVDIDVS